jgi:general secretion pathway protein D
MCSGSVFADVISLQPSSTLPPLGSSFSVDVNITGVTDLYAFQFDIGFNPAVLSAASVSEGSLFSSIGVVFSPGLIDNIGGTITFIGDSLSGPGPGVSTDGTLATITFDTIGVGSSSIDLANIVLLDSSLADIAVTDSGTTVTVATVPEPGSWLLLGSCLVLLFGWIVDRRRFGGGARAPSDD